MQETATTTIAAGPWALTAFIGYLALLIGVGLWASRFSSEGVSEFFVGGRRMNRFVVALSAVVSGRSAWLLLGVTGLAFTRGVSAVWAVAGYTFAELLLFLYYAPRLRRFADTYDCVTVPDFFAARFEDRSGRLRVALAIVILLFMVAYVSAQFVGGGKAMAASFGLPPGVGVLLTAGIVLAYTVTGGFLAVSLTDMIQGIFMIVALLLLPVIAVIDAGGLGPALAQIRGVMGLDFLDPLALAFGVFLGFVGIGLGSPGNPHIIVRYMSIDDPKQLRWVAAVGTTWNVLMGAGAVAIGTLGRLWYADPSALPAADVENLYPMLAQTHLPDVLFGVIVASIFAAIMSTADSQLLVAASSLVRDVYEKVWAKDRAVPQRRLVIYSRSVVVVLVGFALLLGLIADELVFWLVLFAWAGLGAALGPTSVLAIFWRGATRAGIFAGLAVGTLTTIVWYYTPSLKGALYELIPAFALGLLATWAVSRATRPPEGLDAMFAAMEGREAPAEPPAETYIRK